MFHKLRLRLISIEVPNVNENMGQMSQHSLHKILSIFLFVFKQKAVYFPSCRLWGNHTDVAVISQEHPSWGDKQLHLDLKTPWRKETDFGGASYLQVSSDLELEATKQTGKNKILEDAGGAWVK